MYENIQETQDYEDMDVTEQLITVAYNILLSSLESFPCTIHLIQKIIVLVKYYLNIPMNIIQWFHLTLLVKIHRYFQLSSVLIIM